MSEELPSGATSHSRAATNAAGRSADSSSSATTCPSSSIRPSSGAVSQHSDAPSSGRWSAGPSADPPSPHHTPADSPVSCSPRSARGAPPRSSVRVSTFGDGQAASATQRPGRSAQPVTGPIGSCMYVISAGSSKKPFASPLSAWSKKRRTSCRNPIAGPGAPASGPVWPQGPIRPRTGPPLCSTMRRTMSR